MQIQCVIVQVRSYVHTPVYIVHVPDLVFRALSVLGKDNQRPRLYLNTSVELLSPHVPYAFLRLRLYTSLEERGEKTPQWTLFQWGQQ